MKNCKVLVPFINCDNGVALDVNKIVELNEERAAELEGKGLVEIITNPLISNELSDSIPPEDENSTNLQTMNDDNVPSEKNDEDNEEKISNPDDEDNEEEKSNSDDEDNEEEKSNSDEEQAIEEGKNKNKKNKK